MLLLKVTKSANLSFSRAMRTPTAFRVQKRDCSASSSASVPLRPYHSDVIFCRRATLTIARTISELWHEETGTPTGMQGVWQADLSSRGSSAAPGAPERRLSPAGTQSWDALPALLLSWRSSFSSSSAPARSSSSCMLHISYTAEMSYACAAQLAPSESSHK